MADTVIGEVPAYPYGTRLRVRNRHGEIVAVGTLTLHWFGFGEALDIADDGTGDVDHTGKVSTHFPELGDTFELLEPADPGWDPRHVGTLTAIWTEE